MNTRSLLLVIGVGVAAAAAAVGQAQELANFAQPTLKGDFRFSDPPALPSESLGLLPPEEAAEEPLCGPQFAGHPTAIGDREKYGRIVGAAKGIGRNLLSRALSSATGGAVQSGGRGDDENATEPPLYEDPIPKKARMKVKNRDAHVDLDLGGRVATDGILLSTRIDDARDKGTVHEIYLERDDCRRIYPFADYTYELWGEWNLSVSWTKTESTFRDGNLVDQQTSSGGFTRSGEGFLDAATSAKAFREAMEDVPPELQGPLAKYQAQVQEELGPPMWQRLGFVAPTSGARTVGNKFKMSPADLEALSAGRYRLIVQVTREQGPFYQAVGVPVGIGIGAEGSLTFAEIEDDD
jgi:hypothetical protein